MSWLFLLLSIGALVLAFTTQSTWILALSLIASLGLFLAGVMGLLAQRVGNRTRPESLMIDPAELQRLREQAETRRNLQPEDGNHPAP